MRTVTEMELHDIESSIEAILFASGEPVHMERIAAVLGIDAETVAETADRLADRYSFERRGWRWKRGNRPSSRSPRWRYWP